MVSVLIEEIEMSDAIREAFEAWWRGWSNIAPTRQGEGYAEVAENVAWTTWQAALQSQTAPAPPSVAVPENEIKARALEEYADQLDVVFANAQEAGATDCPAWHAGQFAKDARKQAARLRTAGDEGEGSPTHNGGESE